MSPSAELAASRDPGTHSAPGSLGMRPGLRYPESLIEPR